MATSGRDVGENRMSGLTRLTLGLVECRNAGLAIPDALAQSLEGIEDRMVDLTNDELEQVNDLREFLYYFRAVSDEEAMENAEFFTDQL